MYYLCKDTLPPTILQRIRLNVSIFSLCWLWLHCLYAWHLPTDISVQDGGGGGVLSKLASKVSCWVLFCSLISLHVKQKCADDLSVNVISFFIPQHLLNKSAAELTYCHIYIYLVRYKNKRERQLVVTFVPEHGAVLFSDLKCRTSAALSIRLTRGPPRAGTHATFWGVWRCRGA